MFSTPKYILKQTFYKVCLFWGQLKKVFHPKVHFKTNVLRSVPFVRTNENIFHTKVHFKTNVFTKCAFCGDTKQKCFPYQSTFQNKCFRKCAFFEDTNQKYFPQKKYILKRNYEAFLLRQQLKKKKNFYTKVHFRKMFYKVCLLWGHKTKMFSTQNYILKLILTKCAFCEDTNEEKKIPHKSIFYKTIKYIANCVHCEHSNEKSCFQKSSFQRI